MFLIKFFSSFYHKVISFFIKMIFLLKWIKEWTKNHGSLNYLYFNFQVYFKQKCKACGDAKNPFRVRNLQCPDCGLDRDDCECECVYCEKHRYDCECEFDDEETGPDKPHMSDLCMKCLAGLPCQRGDDTDRPRRRRRRRRGRRRD